jgi:hypothetical protein
VRVVLLIALLGAALAGCGDDSTTVESGPAAAWVDPDGDPPIVGSLTVDPADSVHYMATNVRFAWADSGDLYRIDPGGPVKLSTDGGRTWQDRGSTGGEPQALTVDGDGKLYAALIDGTVTVSDDGGRTFRAQVAGG